MIISRTPPGGDPGGIIAPPWGAIFKVVRVCHEDLFAERKTDEFSFILTAFFYLSDFGSLFFSWRRDVVLPGIFNVEC